ncbi:hypothetical protein AQI95_21275 [Streptomyces yokosukanensis]|uniref:Uncharacterized protein n=1 Tax=Streptomyces yokosukanensis TaxID=67386 RepID=A0A124HFI3_9ACTN|nr:hypothetical protein [Streptomyces yokosukanensis]KUN03973.1 hypothetical protein AQI95_21275 [Streptomyces yokosukanensis]
MTGRKATQAPATAAGALPPALTESTDLQTAVRIARRMLLAYSDTTGFDLVAYAQAHSGLHATVRMLLRALDTEPVSGIADTPRCPAAHPEDLSPCVGPVVVTVLDAQNAGAHGCEHHGARLLASLEGGRVYALGTSPEAAAIRVFKAAAGLRPFCWLTDAPRIDPSQLSDAENRARGEVQ